MSFEWSGYEFEGGFDNAESLKGAAGIYMVFANRKVLDIGESGNVKDRVMNHDRRKCWEKEASEHSIHYAAYYMIGSTEEARMKVEKELRSVQSLPCGDR